MNTATRLRSILVGVDGSVYSHVATVLRNASRPVVTVPLSLPQGEDVLVAYDGSRSAARALFAFVASGLGERRKVHIVNVARGDMDSASIAQRAFDFLELHDIKAQLHTASTADDVYKVVLSLAAEVDAGLLVAGAYGHSRLREFVFGSTTKKMIQESQIPIFMFHSLTGESYDERTR